MSKKFLGLVCFLYSAIIIYVWATGLLKNFLAPNMQLYIKVSTFIFIPMGLVLIFNNKVNYKFKISDLILLLPLILLIVSNDGRLTASLANNRFNNISSYKNNKDDNIQEESKEDEEDKNIEDIETVLLELPEEKIQITNKPSNTEKSYYFDVIDSSYVDLANYLTFGSTSNKYNGYSIRVRGFAVTKSSFLPDGYFLLGKYGSNCCVADSTFTGFYIKYDLNNITKNNWYEITGVLKEGKDSDGLPIMYIEPDAVNDIDSSKEETYVWPCYTYDDGLCKELQKYNLEY